jgi:hypothetical protein
MTYFIAIYWSLAVALTASLTALICRRQIGRSRHACPSAAYGGAFGGAALAVILSVFHSFGSRAYSLETWTNPALPGIGGYLLQWALTGLICVVPAAFVVAIWQRKGLKEHRT